MRLLSFACLLLGIQSLTAQTGCIKGEVLDGGGAGIPFVYIFGASAGFSFELSADLEGSFQMTGIPAGNYQVTASDESLIRPNQKPAPAFGTKVEAPGDGTCASLTLRLPARARLRVSATDLLTAGAVASPGASFRLSAHGNWEGVVNEERELLVPPSTHLEVVIGALGYETSEPIGISDLNPGEVRDLTARLRAVQTSCIAGKVVDEQGAPLVGVHVEANLMEKPNEARAAVLGRSVPPVTTNDNGWFRFGQVHPGPYLIFANAENAGYPVALEPQPLVVLSGAACADITIIKHGPKAGKLHLAVVDAVTQKALEYSGSASSDHSSVSLIANPVPVPALKELQITVTAPGYQKHTVTISPLQPEEVRDLRIELQPQTVHRQPRGSIRASSSDRSRPR